MSTNLYAQTDDTAVLEKLAGVPAGTSVATYAWMQRYPASSGRFETHEADQAAFEIWDAEATPNMHRFQTFSDYGFGRITLAAWAVAQAISARVGEHPATGITADPNDMHALLCAQGVQLPAGVSLSDIGSLSWS